MISFEPFAAQTCAGVERRRRSRRRQVGGQVGAQCQRLAVRIAVQRRRRPRRPPRRSPRRPRPTGGYGFSLVFSRTGDVELRRAVGPPAAQFVAQRQVVEAIAIGRGIMRQPDRTAAPCAGRSSASASAITCGATSASASRVVLDQVDALEERLHRQPAACRAVQPVGSTWFDPAQ